MSDRYLPCASRNLCLHSRGPFSGLPVLIAPSHQPTDVLLTSLATIVHNQSVCCGGDWALTDDVARSDPISLRDVPEKLPGRHLLGDRRPIMLTAGYLDPAMVNANTLVNTLHYQNALVFEWNSHVYVCYGVT
jgi:hypothetical protein